MPTRREQTSAPSTSSTVPRRVPFHDRGDAPEERNAILQLRLLLASSAVPSSTNDDTPTRLHLNHMWESYDAVHYPRYAPGPAVPVSFPNSKQAASMVDPTHLLVTKALNTPHRLYNHCAHYFFNGACDLGAECGFIHMVFVAPEPTTPNDAFAATERRASSNVDETPFSLGVVQPRTDTFPPPIEAFIASTSTNDNTPARTPLQHLSTPIAAATRHVAPAPTHHALSQKRRADWWYRDPYTATRVLVAHCDAA